VVGIEVKLPREFPKGLSLLSATHSHERKHLNYSRGEIRSSFCRLLMGSIRLCRAEIYQQVGYCFAVHSECRLYV